PPVRRSFRPAGALSFSKVPGITPEGVRMSISDDRLRELHEWSRPYEASGVPALRRWSFTALSSGVIGAGYLAAFSMLIASGKADFDWRVLRLGAVVLGALHFSAFVVWVHEAAHCSIVPNSPRW